MNKVGLILRAMISKETTSIVAVETALMKMTQKYIANTRISMHLQKIILKTEYLFRYYFFSAHS